MSRAGSSDIFCVEQNIHGAWVVYGAIGVRQYYFYTKKQAMALYRRECRSKIVYNRS